MTDEEIINKYSWMVRPCLHYKEEYSECTSIRARLNQYFIYGTFIDCSQWKHDHNNCLKWTEKNDIKSFRELLLNEVKRKNERLAAHAANDVWEPRESPPSDWNAPLPDWMLARNKNSVLAVYSGEAKNEQSTPRKLSFCSIF